MNKTRRWHIDYLLPHTVFLEAIVTKTSRNLECRIARSIGETQSAVAGFGCTDCGCTSHLHYSRDLQPLQDAVRLAYATARQSARDIAASA